MTSKKLRYNILNDQYLSFLDLKGGDYMTEYMSYTQAMKYLGFKSRSALETYIAAGLPVIKVGRSKRISKTAIDKFMAEHQTSTANAESKSVKEGA